MKNTCLVSKNCKLSLLNQYFMYKLTVFDHS